MAAGAPVLVTGAAGFIGFHLSARLLDDAMPVIGVDNLSDYYDVSLKEARLARLRERDGFDFRRLDLADRDGVARLFREIRPRLVLHMAAQAGVRHSLQQPHAYTDSNLTGFLNLLEGCRHNGCAHLVFASSSSVYGANTRLPFSVHDNVDHPVSLYAATKKANELMAHSYSHLYRLPVTGLRFFTVYGPWGRPDMAYFKFTRAIHAGQPIQVYNHGDMQRDFTYIDDVVEGVLRVAERPPQPDPDWNGNAPDPGGSTAPYRIYNIGNHTPVALTEMIATLERLIGRTAVKEMLPLQPGDVPVTCADVTNLMRDTGFAPATPLEEGLRQFVTWYREYYGNK